MNIAILGAGPGALTLAACLAQKQYHIRLYEQVEFKDNILELAVKKSIVLNGIVNATAQLELVTTNLAEAVLDADYIFLVTHAAAHAPLAKALAPMIQNHQTIVLLPGYIAGALTVEYSIKEHNHLASPCIVESSALPFACRRTDPCSVFVGGWKSEFLLASCRTTSIVKPLTDLFGELTVSNHMLESGLNEVNFIIHSCISLSNAGRLDGGDEWTFYREGLTPAVGRLIEEADHERLALLGRLGLPQISLTQWLLRFYKNQGAKGETVYEVLYSFEHFATSKGPTSFAHRYFSEDIPYGLVPLAHLGALHQVSMPVINTLIDWACLITATDYRAQGRKISTSFQQTDQFK